MEPPKRSIKTSIPLKILEFPDEFSQLKGKCSMGDIPRQYLNPVRSCDMGKPAIMSIRKPISISSSYNITSPTESFSKSLTKNPLHLSSSKNIHMNLFKGDKQLQFKKPCADSVLLGAPKSFVGNCPGIEKKHFKLTEDPRKRFCLTNPAKIHFKPISQHSELKQIKELVKTAENVISISESQSSSSSICEVIDLSNPLGLDFQGNDYKNTYERDEQSCQNQIEYRKVRRFQHRRNVQLETAHNTKIEQQAQRIAIPAHFHDSSSTQITNNLKLLNEKSNFYGKLIRTEQKTENKQRLEEEDERRKQRYKKLYIAKQQKTMERDELKILDEENAAENNANMLAEKDVQDFVKLLDRNVITKKMNLRNIPERRKFPHNISETLRFRYEMKKSKRVLRDRAKTKQEFYEEIGKQKQMNEALLEISSDSHSPDPISDEQSTNDEDDMVVGQKSSKFLLRGFRYKLGCNLRGKLNQKQLAVGDGKIKGCMTRTEWFDTLVSKKIYVNEKKNGEMKLFPPELGLKQFVTTSAIKEFRKKPLGRHYESAIRKKLHIKKPKKVKVKKFNLIGYLYGNTTRKSIFDFKETQRMGHTQDYMRNKTEGEKFRQMMQKRRRMRYLGIPCPQEKIRIAKTTCLDSESDDSDWIPDETAADIASTEHVDLRNRANMPAPENRETSLRRHPRHSRNYKQLRVPSAILDDFIKTQHVPILTKLKDDKYVAENVRNVENTEYANKFDARHHHDHWNPTQHKTVHVRYSRKIVKPKALEGKYKHNALEKPSRTFDKARPRDSDLEEQDFAMPKLCTDELIENHRTKTTTAVKGQIQEQLFCETEDKVIHSLDEPEFQQFPSRDKFINFIQEIKAELNKRAGKMDTELVIDKSAYIKELKEDLLSIESCLTSLSSSECTNFSNDSGSFLMAGEKKIPLDYLRKSVVPFEEMNRGRIKAVPIEATKGELNPYRTMPFSGQQKEQLSMTAAKDNFFTFNTRLQNGLRQRLEVKPENLKEKLIGAKNKVKAISKVATDIDELYIEDLKKPPPLKLFKWNSCRTMLKDALRKKFESMLIQGEIVRTKIYDRRNEEYFQQMKKTKELFEKLFSKWEKKEYEAAMAVVNKVKPYYEATDVYRKEHQELSKQFTVLNMDIVYIENDWTRRTILQNFHYLLGDMKWRVKHDWIHRNLDGSLESFDESIAKRSIVNIRRRDKDDAWAIKEYYEKIYLQNPHPIIVVFENAKQFINGIENLKSKTFLQLLELHYTLSISAELTQKYLEISDWCRVELESKKKFAENKCANKYYMEKRAEQLRDQVEVFLGDPIDVTFGDKQLSQIKGICNEVYKDIVPIADQSDLSALDQVAAISQVLTDLIGKFEKIPSAQRVCVEKKLRRMLAYRRNMSKQAVRVERRIASEMVKVQRNLAPPFQKPKRKGKLPRSEMKKLVRESRKKEIPMSEQAKFFYKAFHDEGDPKGLTEARESLDVINGIQQSIVPFYFDHFLIINGYKPNYEFKTQVELRDGPEIDRMQVKRVLPEVLDKFEKWQIMQKTTMEENISKNPHMYQNVQI